MYIVIVYCVIQRQKCDSNFKYFVRNGLSAVLEGFATVAAIVVV